MIKATVEMTQKKNTLQGQEAWEK